MTYGELPCRICGKIQHYTKLNLLAIRACTYKQEDCVGHNVAFCPASQECLEGAINLIKDNVESTAMFIKFYE